MKSFKYRTLKTAVCFLFALICTLLSITISMSEENTTKGEKEPIRIGEITVTATRVEESIWNIPSSVTVITKEEIENSTATNITEILRDVAGLRISEYGNRGALALPQLRGATAGQILILLDGRRLNSPGSGQFNLNDIPLPIEDIERIEILREASSALYGADALGGVINIITKKPSETQTVIGASYGRFDTQKYSLTSSGRFKSLGYLLSASRDKSDGFRQNSYYELASLNGKLGLDITNKSSLDLTVSYLDKEAGVPGSVTFTSPNAVQTDENTLLGLAFRWGHINNLDVVARTYINYYRIRFRDPDTFTDDTHKDTATTGEVQIDYLYNKYNRFTGGFEIGKEERKSTAIGTRDRSRGGLFLQDGVRLGDTVTIIPGVRYDTFSPGEEQLSPRISGLYKIKDARFRASLGKGFRIPTLNDLYWPDTIYAKGNPELRPERSVEYEIGWDQVFSENILTKITVFRRDVKDLIVWQPDLSFKYSPSNIGKARIDGIELEGEINIHKFFSIDLNYTYLNPVDRNTGEKIKNLPQHQLNTSLNIYSPFGSGLFLYGRYTKNYALPGNISDYFVMDGKITHKINLFSGIKGDLFVGVNNIFDKEYEVVKGYPMPPREFYGGLSVAF